MSTKSEPGPFDGMAKAAPDEPVFTLRAHDPLAPWLVKAWVWQRRQFILLQHHKGEITDAKRAVELLQCKEAEEIAWAMERWHLQEEEAGDAPPATERDRARTMMGATLTSEEELAARARYEAIKRAGAILGNAIAGVHEVATEVLAPLGLETERAVLLLSHERIKAVAAHIAPKRASYHPGDEVPEPFPISQGIVNATHLSDLWSDLSEAANASASSR